MATDRRTIDARQIAFEVLERVESGAYSDLVLSGVLRRYPTLDSRDRRLATELVYGVLRLRNRVDFALGRFCSRPFAKLELPVQTLLRLGGYQILCLDSIPPHAAVHATVEMAKRNGLHRAAGLINAILRKLVEPPKPIPWPKESDVRERMIHWCSLPDWMADRLIASYGEKEALALAMSFTAQAPVSLRVNRMKCDVADYRKKLSEAGIDAEPSPWIDEALRIGSGGELPGDAEGLFQIQDEASMLVVHLLDPQPGEKILDACAAPGGKSTLIVELTGNRAAVTAVDLHPQRVDLITAGAKRLGCAGITTLTHDMTTPSPLLHAESFDRVLVDAPCSGLGVIRRSPEIRWRRTGGDILELAALQRRILDQVAGLVKPGGLLVYSVCTMTTEESTGVVDAFCAAHPEFSIEREPGALPAAARTMIDAEGALRPRPDLHGTDAFYAVRLRRKA